MENLWNFSEKWTSHFTFQLLPTKRQPFEIFPYIWVLARWMVWPPLVISAISNLDWTSRAPGN
jgi:hypothetical protein